MKLPFYFKRIFFLLFAGSICFNMTFKTEADWQLKKNANGILVYTRESTELGIKEVKCVTHFKSSLSGLVAFIKDIPQHPNYIYRCKSAFIIKNVNDSELYYYHETATPWPVENRYGVIYYKIKQDSKTKIVRIDSKEILNMYPKQPNMVEVPKLRASWEFVTNKNGEVESTYYILLNPGGNIPVWLINLFVIDGPYNTILKMKELLKQEKYQKAKLNYIQEVINEQ
jgi:hypothetical protein